MGTVNKNIIANIAGKGWSLLSVFIFIPIYLDILGIKMYGVISFYTVLQGVLIFADAGLTATLKRELAKGDNFVNDREYKYKILKSIETIYFLIVAIITIGIYFCANFIVESWLNIQDLNQEATREGIQLMGAGLALNFLSTLYQGGLLGLERQIASNVFQITWSLLKNGGVILALLLIDNSLFVFFIWQVGVNIIYVLCLRLYIIKTLKENDVFNWKFTKDIFLLNYIWKYAFGMLAISMIAAVNSQFDKIFLSKFITVSELAIYTISYSMAMIPIAFSGPVSTAIFPKFVNHSHKKENSKLSEAFNNSFKIVLLIAGSMGVVLAIYSELFIELWTQDKEVARLAAMPAFFLILGQMFLSFQIIPFNLVLAQGNTKLNIRMGLIGLTVLIPLVVFMTITYGMLGAAVSWFIYSLLFTPIYIYIIVKYRTNLSVVNWIINQFLKPLSIIVIGNALFYFIKPDFYSNVLFSLIYITISSLIVFLIAFRITFNIHFNETFKFIKNELFA